MQVKIYPSPDGFPAEIEAGTYYAKIANKIHFNYNIML
jgi:hypothetical protein